MKIKFTENQHTTTTIAMFDEYDRVLILKRSPTASWEPNRWSLVNSMEEDEENSEEALKREVKEETALDIWTVKFFKDIQTSWGTLSIFTANTEGSPIFDYENTEYAWIRYEDIDEYEYIPYVKGILKLVLNPKNW